MFFRNPTVDLLIVLLIVLVIFGPKRLPMLGRQLGHGLREFKESITGQSKDVDGERPEITQSSTVPVPSPGPASANPPREPTEVAPSGTTPARGSAEIGSEHRS